MTNTIQSFRATNYDASLEYTEHQCDYPGAWDFERALLLLSLIFWSFLGGFLVL